VFSVSLHSDTIIPTYSIHFTPSIGAGMGFRWLFHSNSREGSDLFPEFCFNYTI